MRPLYVVQSLAPDRSDQAYPVVRLQQPALALDQWRSLCRAALASGDHAGREPGDPDAILICIDSLGYIRGPCMYRIAYDSGRRPVLSVPTFIASSTLDPAGVAMALLRSLAAISRELHCTGLRVGVSEEDAPTGRFLAAHGFVASPGGLFWSAEAGAPP